MAFTALKDLLPKIAREKNLGIELNAAWVMNRATAAIRELFPETYARGIRAKMIKQECLTIAVDNSALAQEVQMKSHLIQRRINGDLKSQAVKRIRILQDMIE